MIEIEDKLFHINACIDKKLYDYSIKQLKETIKIVKRLRRKRR